MTDTQLLEVIDASLTLADSGIVATTSDQKLLGAIYRWVHGQLETSCHHVHEDWRKEADEVRQGLLSAGEINSRLVE